MSGRNPHSIIAGGGHAPLPSSSTSISRSSIPVRGSRASGTRPAAPGTASRVDAVAVRRRGGRRRGRARLGRPAVRRRSVCPELHAPHHRADGRRRARPSTPSPREIYDDWAEHHHFSLYDDVPTRCSGAARARHPARADLELASLPGVVPVALRAGRPDRRRRVVVRSRLHEAASEHLSRRARADAVSRRGEAVMVGDSLHARRARRARRRDARRFCSRAASAARP